MCPQNGTLVSGEFSRSQSLDLVGMAVGRVDLANDFDPVRRTSKWKAGEKLATFIADGLRARMARGSAFIGGGRTNE
jgi:hypothetical protein